MMKTTRRSRNRVRLTERHDAFLAGWQAQASVRGATHLNTTYYALDHAALSSMPDNFSDCLQLGRDALNVHVNRTRSARCKHADFTNGGWCTQCGQTRAQATEAR